MKDEWHRCSCLGMVFCLKKWVNEQRFVTIILKSGGERHGFLEGILASEWHKMTLEMSEGISD